VSLVTTKDQERRQMQALQRFDEQLAALGVSRRISSYSVPEKSVSHSSWLVNMRNLSLEPLSERENVDWVLFSDSVFVEAGSIVELLNTKAGDYDVACGIDADEEGYVFRSYFRIFRLLNVDAVY